MYITPLKCFLWKPNKLAKISGLILNYYEGIKCLTPKVVPWETIKETK